MKNSIKLTALMLLLMLGLVGPAIADDTLPVGSDPNCTEAGCPVPYPPPQPPKPPGPVAYS